MLLTKVSRFFNLLTYEPNTYPPSLKWLIDKRARLLGEITKYEKSSIARIAKARGALDQAKHQYDYENIVKPKLISVLRAELSAIDVALSLHEIQIAPESIPQIRTVVAEKQLPYGAITKSIYQCLKCAGKNSISTTEIAAFIALQHNLELSEDTFFTFRQSVRYRLKSICVGGKIEL